LRDEPSWPPKRWWIATGAVWMVASLVQLGVNAVSQDVETRDLGSVPGAWAPIEDFVFQNGWWIALAVPLAVEAPNLIPHGYPEDSYIPFIILAICLAGIVVAALLMAFVRPVED
jgi:hypothetical protein